MFSNVYTSKTNFMIVNLVHVLHLKCKTSSFELRRTNFRTISSETRTESKFLTVVKFENSFGCNIFFPINIRCLETHGAHKRQQRHGSVFSLRQTTLQTGQGETPSG